MKKLFIILAVATFAVGFVACNNETEVPYEETQAYKDSVAAKATADSLAAEAAKAAAMAPDSTGGDTSKPAQ